MNHASHAITVEPPRTPDISRGRAVVCAVLMPHAPVLVPAVGGARGDDAEASCRAMRAAAAEVIRHRPEALVVISPHSPRKPGAFGLWADDRLYGSFAQFGAPQAQVILPNDWRLAEAIEVEAQSRHLSTWAIHLHQLDHGALVPLWFLAAAGWAGPTVIISLDYSNGGGLPGLGEAIAAAASRLGRDVAIIASGDMSHRLTADAPCGFNPQAKRFDEMFIRLIGSGDYRKIQNLQPELREAAAEDAVDSTVVAVAAAGWDCAGHKVLNYEGPFGVGYGVAILFAEDSSSAGTVLPLAEPAWREGAGLPGIARQSVAAALCGSSEGAPPASGKYLTSPRGVFVTVRRRDGALRGCVGTILPVSGDLNAETWRNARLAALEDGRFPPVKADELVDLRFHVSVIHSLEEVLSVNELQPGRYGVLVSTSDGRRGALLPGIKEIETGEQQLDLARKKGWIDADEPIRVQRFQVDNFDEPA